MRRHWSDFSQPKVLISVNLRYVHRTPIAPEYNVPEGLPDRLSNAKYASAFRAYQNIQLEKHYSISVFGGDGGPWQPSGNSVNNDAMGQSWAEYVEHLRKELYRLNMELPYWEAKGDQEMVRQIKDLITETNRVLDNDGRAPH